MFMQMGLQTFDIKHLRQFYCGFLQVFSGSLPESYLIHLQFSAADPSAKLGTARTDLHQPHPKHKIHYNMLSSQQHFCDSTNYIFPLTYMTMKHRDIDMLQIPKHILHEVT